MAREISAGVLKMINRAGISIAGYALMRLTRIQVLLEHLNVIDDK
jgi:hypothetical protein